MFGNKMFEIKDKILLITGAAAGIGASVVKNFLKEDIKHITILDINDENGFAIEKELNTEYGSNKVKFIKCDVTQEQELLNAFSAVKSEQGYIDIVINNAGIANDKAFAKEIEINLTALVRNSLQAWDVMREDKGGRGGTIINVASIAAIAHVPVLSVYSATKAAVVKFSTTLGDALHYSTTGVRVLSVCFGVTDTQLVNRQISSFNRDIEDSISPTLRSYKWQTPEEAAQGVSELYKRGTSGSVWVVTNGKPAVDITERYIQTTQMFDDILLS